MSKSPSLQYDQIFKALGVFIEAFRPYVVSVLQKEAGDKWPEWYFDSLTDKQKHSWIEGQKSGTENQNLIDFHNLKGFVLKYKQLLREDFGGKANSLPTWLEEIADVRHKCTHYQEIEDRDINRAFENMLLIAEHTGMGEVGDRIKELQKPAEKKIKSQQVQEESVPHGQALPWFIQVTPHLDIRQDRLDESVFAANLAEVALGSGREIYRNPADFFSKTYFTKGLRTLAHKVIRGLNGGVDVENRVISLQTGFGGGKTHSLISLYHLVKLGKKAVNLQGVIDAFGEELKWDYDQANIAVFTNTTNDPTQGRIAEGGQRISTLWGEIAWQLGGEKTYDLIRANDEKRTSPKGLFKKVLEQSAPCMILIDELADYCHAASGIEVGSSTLGDQTISFIQELSEAVSLVDKCVLVATLPASAAEVGATPKAAQVLDSLSSRFTRVGADTKPVEDEEIFEVIRRRLFDDLGDEAGIEKAVDQYFALYQSLYQELPARTVQSEYKNLMRKSYPFHPELVDVFRKRWAAHHDFQRTRGVLRILASIVADLWNRQRSLPGVNYMIHTSDVNFNNLDALSGQLKKLYGNGYDAVMTADVSGSSSNAALVDREKSDYGKHYLAQGVSSTILLNSFGTEGANRGIGIEHIKLCMVKPDGFNHNSINGVLDELEGCAHYLYYSTAGTTSKRYWFYTKPNINILVNQAGNDVDKDKIESEIIDRLEKHSRNVARIKVILPGNEQIPELKSPTLVILKPDYSADMNQINGRVGKIVRQIATQKGNSERIYRNTLLFLTCTDNGSAQLKNEVKEYLACRKILQDYQGQLDNEQKEDLKTRISDANKKVESALVSAYTLVLKHSGKEGVRHLVLQQFRSRLDEQIGGILFDKLKEEEWLLESVGLHLMQKNNLLPSVKEPIKAKDIYEAFLRYDDKPMITGPEAVQRSLLRYCREGNLGIASGDGTVFTNHYYKETPSYFDVSDDTYWIIHKDDVPDQVEDGSPTIGGDETPDGGRKDIPIPDSDTSPEPVIPSLTISGRVDLANYSQIFTSFIMPLKDNNVEIEVTIRAKSNQAKPITANSQQYKIVKESASQLGLRFEEGG